MASTKKSSRLHRGVMASVAIVASAAMLAACSSSSSSSSSSAAASEAPAASAAASTAASAASESGVPQASPEALQAMTSKMFMSDTLKYDELNPILQTTINKMSTPLTDAQWTKLQECLQATSCDTGNPGDLVVAYANDGINPWRQTWRANFTAAAIQSPEIGKIVYNLAPEVPKWIANVNSLIAQGVDIIALNSVYGAAVLPAVNAAREAGVTVVSTGTPMPPEVQSAVSTYSEDDLCTPWQLTADKLISEFPDGGTYGLYTGVPGNSSAAAWQPCLTEKLDAAGWEKVIEGFTDWTPQGMAREGSALYASGKNPTFVAYDYTLEDFVKPFIEAGENPPITGTDALNTEFLRVATEALAQGIDMNAYVSSAREWYGAVAIEQGLLAQAGQTVEPFLIPSGFKDLEQLLADYDPAMPANTPIPTWFTPEQQDWILKAQA